MPLPDNGPGGLGSHQGEGRVQGLGFGLEQWGWYCCGEVNLEWVSRGHTEIQPHGPDVFASCQAEL